MPPPIPQNNLDENVDPKLQTGKASSAVIVGFIGIVALVLVVTYFMFAMKSQNEASERVQHTAEEQAAYRFTEQKKRVSDTKAACEKNMASHQSLKIWVEQQRLRTRPPAEYLIDVSCAAVVEKDQ
jgi:flagellar basal body-associated protein FliL